MTLSEHDYIRNACSLLHFPLVLWFICHICFSFYLLSPGASLEIYLFPVLYSSITWQGQFSGWRGGKWIVSHPIQCNFSIDVNCSSILPSLVSLHPTAPSHHVFLWQQALYWAPNPLEFMEGCSNSAGKLSLSVIQNNAGFWRCMNNVKTHAQTYL